ncbi:Sensor protein ZraS [Gemmata obscuriglobus]|uniref:histidine kinase n=1 Tax=Gemmata obscuriglobus TaxID=114 RepID=A0A2Z3H7A5_9BACT|nr:ATP-binding protein [Gemmata obscuriglobus]AWM40262.1 two-component sensor histidine kinase [Gemmata obscuriglobus]QEG26539.1 Sensor protein ZraS [Gemmata obscuriglobus]VTS01904.1 signal transduction histidine-protein kinase : Histidine kinase OS=Singulisphaera acidiphila (strain ATCC BAA-1392 / DSM 18658 / VKM B-2454 / MOB10) GN=Sinac_2375 PE=4 SV=1: HisKA: HATPase_c [Gemmata obscuriglobus UQM 2246]
MGRARVVVVVLVFVVSLAALAASSALALWQGTDELATRDQLRAAATDLAAALPELPPDRPGAVLPEPDNRRLAEAARRVLANYPGAEGGFYFTASDQFAGAVVGGSGNGDGEKKDKKKGDHKKSFPKEDEGRPSGAVAVRREPPPLETASIRQQCREAARAEAGWPPAVEVRDVGPSRVAVAAAGVGGERPARAAVWVMVRLTGPEQQKTRLGRLQLATGLSLGGVLLALTLAGWLVGSLRAEARRRERLGEELRKSEHLAALGRLLAGVAHEVRNPLTAIRSTVQLWERLPAAARTPESLAAVVGSVDRINELVGRLLLFARAGHEARRPVDLNAVTAETLELVRARADALGVALEPDLAPGLPPVPGAAQAVGQVVLNLVTNALQAMPAGGRLTCRTRATGGRVELAVTDTGPGVPPEARDRAFEPFFTTRADGTGLGLALCREVARQHGGDVTLDPPGGAGATFRLTLPLAPSGGLT